MKENGAEVLPLNLRMRRLLGSFWSINSGSDVVLVKFKVQEIKA